MSRALNFTHVFSGSASTSWSTDFIDLTDARTVSVHAFPVPNVSGAMPYGRLDVSASNGSTQATRGPYTGSSGLYAGGPVPQYVAPTAWIGVPGYTDILTGSAMTGSMFNRQNVCESRWKVDWTPFTNSSGSIMINVAVKV